VVTERPIRRMTQARVTCRIRRRVCPLPIHSTNTSVGPLGRHGPREQSVAEQCDGYSIKPQTVNRTLPAAPGNYTSFGTLYGALSMRLSKAVAAGFP
jgi:hypothetical protein